MAERAGARPTAAAPAGAGRAHATSRAGRPPAAVWALTALWGGLLLGASLLWPMLYGYDEAAHVDMAYAYSAAPFHLYGPAQLHYSVAVRRAADYLPTNPPRPALDRQPVLSRSARPTLAQLGGQARPSSDVLNQMVEHPPLYYELAGAVLRVPGVSSLSWDVQVWLMRLVSVVLVLPVPLLCWAATRRLLSHAVSPARPTPGDAGAITAPESHLASTTALVAAVIPLTIPNMVRDGSAVTNDSLLILTVSIFLYGLVRVLTGDRSVRTATWIALAMVAALYTKGFALVLPPVAVLAYLVGPALGGARIRPGSLVRPLGVVVIGAVIGCTWWLRNLVDYGTVQTDGLGAGSRDAVYGPPNNNGTLYSFVPRFTTDFISRIWGGVGLPDLPSVGPLITYGWFVVVFIGVAAGLLARGRGRAAAWVLVSVPVLTLLLVGEGSFNDFRHWTNYTHGSQGRYIYQAVVAIAALAVVGWHRVLRPGVWARLLPLTLAAAILTNLATWYLIVRSWYATGTGTRGLGTGAHAVLHWSPVPEGLTLLLLTLPVVCSAVALVAVGRDAARLRPSLPEGDRRVIAG